MKVVRKKILISILSSIIILFTMIATTYAWVGIFTYSSVEGFDINLKVVDLNSEYYLTISSTGEKDSFSDEIPLYELQKQIMNNFDIDYSSIDSSNAEAINMYFNKSVQLSPATAYLDDDKNIKSFEEIANMDKGNAFFRESHSYYKFDLYLSIDTKEGINENTSISASVAFDQIESSLVGTNSEHILINGNTILSNKYKPSNFDINKYPVLSNLDDYITINSASSARFALEIHKPIDINESYNGSETPLKTIIYQGGTAVPSVIDNVYSLGGILPEEYNLAVQEANKLYVERLQIPTEIKAREEYELIYNNRIIFLSDEYEDMYLGVQNNIQTKMKITVYFWFEGWDADCIFAIDNKQVTLNLEFTADIEDEE